MFYSHQKNRNIFREICDILFLFTIREFSKEGTSKYRLKNNMWINNLVLDLQSMKTLIYFWERKT